ncbi:RadC family protein [Phenylobacterium sp.]|uniref:RadC family protein n=1 Tax=Phenylobacterium sp. TaxID=1871053 RepID=UPI002CEB7AA0|nr:DNA repair protein RadC [Phenylobacterium sp.]HVI33766.1 DNA repair protein RadC [Phenylobacterium sp.]
MRAAATHPPNPTPAEPPPGMSDREGERLAELRAFAAEHGLGALSAEEALTVFLARPAGRAAGVLARRLLDRFGSLPEVLGAPRPEVALLAGRRVAQEVRLIHELQCRALVEPFRVRPLLTAWSQVRDYLRAAMAAEPREQFRVLFLDRRNHLIADEVMWRGSVDHAPVYPREVCRRALELNASAVVLAHNHPGRDPTPSAADIEMTRQVVEACRALRIAVHDHLLVAGEEVVSLRAQGVM